jgi:hypothetical protein
MTYFALILNDASLVVCDLLVVVSCGILVDLNWRK